MANDLRDVMIALHPPSQDGCERVVDAWFPPVGSDGHICGCLYLPVMWQSDHAYLRPLNDLFDPTSPKSSIEVQDWLK